MGEFDHFLLSYTKTQLHILSQSSYVITKKGEKKRKLVKLEVPSKPFPSEVAPYLLLPLELRFIH